MMTTTMMMYQYHIISLLILTLSSTLTCRLMTLCT